MLVKTLKPLAMQRQGEVVDTAFSTGDMDSVKEWCKKARDLGVLVGVGTHIPEVIAKVEEENWDVDFYSGCVYNRTRTVDEWKKALNGEIMEMTGRHLHAERSAAHVQSDAADQEALLCVQNPGRRPHSREGIEQAFRTAFESIKPTDGIYVGMFPRVKDEVRENARDRAPDSQTQRLNPNRRAQIR